MSLEIRAYQKRTTLVNPQQWEETYESKSLMLFLKQDWWSCRHYILLNFSQLGRAFVIIIDSELTEFV